jgi:heat shock protein HtpX
MRRVSFLDEVVKNRRSSILLAILVSAILFALVYVLCYIFAPNYIFIALPLAVFLIGLYAYSSYRYGDSVVLSATNAKPTTRREHQYLRDTVEGLSIAAGIQPPRVYVVESKDINAFATGRDPEHASIVVTTGLIEQLNRQELEGVLAHEMSHIRNRDILFMTLVAVLVGLAAILSHVILRAFWYGGVRRSGKRRERRGGSFEVLILLVGFILAIFAPIAVRLVQFAISRRREFLADASGVELTRYPEGLASALEKIMMRNKGDINVSEAVSPLFLTDPKRSPLDSLFATHPPIKERIEKLRTM